MSSITIGLAEILGTIDRPGDFFASGVMDMLAPRLEVEGVGPIALPLLPVQAEQLIATADRAPYGRGADTLTDPTVRRTWQIAPERVRVDGRHWRGTLDTILTRVIEGLGVTGPVDAEFYKLLVYDEGSFFVRHRDTEKRPGMFATLILVLPSVAAGGELVVRHKDREVRLSLRCEDPAEVGFAAFYADCVHEVLPVTAGYRLALIYNLVRHEPGRLPEPPDHAPQQDAVAKLLRDWAEDRLPPDDGSPRNKLVYPLEHAYTPAELSFQALKGADAGIAQVVAGAAEKAGCDVHLALVTVEESGSATYTGYARRGWSRDRDDADDFEVVEVAMHTVTASHWREPGGGVSPLTEIPVEDDEFSPPEAFEDLEPDEEHFHEATGNEGASFERTYRRAALVLWPHDKLLAVINQAGLTASLPYLADLAERWMTSGAGHESPLWCQAHAFSRHMIETWPTGRWFPRRDNESTDTGRMLELLTRLGDVTRLDGFLAEIAARGGFDLGDVPSIAEAIRLLPPEHAPSVTERLIAASVARTIAACGALLAHIASVGHPIVTGAAKCLVDALPDGSRTDVWPRGPGVGPGFVVDLFTALVRIDAALADRAAAHMLAFPGLYDFDTVLIPAVRDLLGRPETAVAAVVERLRVACVGHLDARIAQVLEAPRTWRRESAVGCTCAHCTELSRFLDDPYTPRWVVKAKQADRDHVAGTIRNAGCDLNVTTERRGSPHSLICNKNQASYERRRAQRKKDLEDLERLNAARS